MVLKSFGCSFIFGSELSDDGRNGFYATGSCLTWPALIAEHYGYDYQTFAKPGSGNLQIAERLLNQTTNLAPAFYVIGWTWIDRFDYIDKTNLWPGTKWSTLTPMYSAEDTLAKLYYKDLQSEYCDKLTTLMSIRLSIDTLKQKEYPFIMTYMDDLMFDSTYNTSAAINELQDYIRPYMTRFDNMNFLEWSKKKGYPIGISSHPLEQAHAAAADYILELGVHKV